MKKERLCMDCGKYFNISRREVMQHRKHKKKLPTHCPACRSNRWMEQRNRSRQLKKYRKKKVIV